MAQKTPELKDEPEDDYPLIPWPEEERGGRTKDTELTPEQIERLKKIGL